MRALIGLVISTLVVIAVAIFFLVRSKPLEIAAADDNPSSSDSATPQSPDTEPTEPEVEAEPLPFTIAAGGEMLIHVPVMDSAWNGEVHDFAALMTAVEPYVSGADLSICHLEVPLVPDGQQVSGYPQFAAPKSLADSLARAGWDGCSTASNHSIDRGLAGIEATLSEFDAVGLGHSGTGRSESEALSPQWYQLEQGDARLTVAHISAAHNLNGLVLPSDAQWAVQLGDGAVIVEQARKAREAGADLVIVSSHCCEVEYTTDPEVGQVAFAETLAASGLVDAMIGHHAHVPKPVEKLAGGPRGEGMWVTYGTGNYISNQSSECCREETSSGTITYFEGVVNPDGSAQIVGASWLAVTVDRHNSHRVLPLFADGAANSLASAQEMQRRYALLAPIVGAGGAPEIEGPPTATWNKPEVIRFDAYTPTAQPSAN